MQILQVPKLDRAMRLLHILTRVRLSRSVRATIFMLLAMPRELYAADFDGARLSSWWAIPFAGMLLSIAILPLAIPTIWHRHFGKIAAVWSLAFLVPFALFFGMGTAGLALVHTLIGEYLPFIVLLTALFTVSGGIHVRGNLHGTPLLNVGLLSIGAVLASFMGTTGASMLMIRPLIRANDGRKHVAHIVVFFIFIVSNISGALTPLGDPPLFLGFLKGVAFFWTVGELLPETLFVVGMLLILFYVLDSYYYHRKEEILPDDPTPDTHRLGIDGAINLLPMLAVAGLVLMSGFWQPGVSVDVYGTAIGLQHLVRDVGLIGVTFVSLLLTPAGVRAANEFSWAPMAEVAKLFVGIFLTMMPVLAMLKAGEHGAFSAVVHAVTGPDGRPVPWAYFWFTGALSSFLDNAPTYLVFFNLAGGDAQTLMTGLASTLAAISAGAVFMGANTYIGNAPNFMVKAIAEHQGIRMPSFFGYMLWSCSILLPLFLISTFIWFR